uniref:NAC domain-containing protein n=1 Tax=Kalanchoe fedtschenkoi TaxID=63787 RepID=A0A7N0RIL7_KALFE
MKNKTVRKARTPFCLQSLFPREVSPDCLDTEASQSLRTLKFHRPSFRIRKPHKVTMICRENKPVSPPLPALAPGFRFHPTDEELVRYYLARKVCGKSCRIDAISEADIYKMEPWDLPGLSKMKSRDLEWYFYSALDKKYGNGARMNRATSKGYWKATGNDRSVKHESCTVGMKKTLVFHKGRPPGGKRTNWVMHEYRLVDGELERLGIVKDGYVLCRVFQKSGLGPPNGDQYASFDESQWDDDKLVPGAETGDEGLMSDEAEPRDGSSLEGNGQDENQDTQPEKTKDDLKERSFLGAALVLKNERNDTWSLPSIVRPKRPRYTGSDSSCNPVQNHSSSLPSDPSLSAKLASPMADPADMAARTLLEFPLLNAHDAKENPQPTPPSSSSRFDIASFNMPVHPSYLDLISNLQNEIHSVSAERENLRIEMMHAQAMIDVLQSRVNLLLQENEGLRRSA